MKVEPTRGGYSVVTASLLPLALTLLAVAALVWPAWPGVARADACRVETDGQSSPAWRDASAALVELALTERDCVSVHIQISEDRARVLFTTADGRSAERLVATPAELRPTIDALRVQAPALAAQPPAAATTPASPPKPTAPRAASTSEPDDRPLRLALLAGARGGADSLLSPLLVGALFVGWGVLELGATLGAEVQYYDMQGDEDPARYASSAAALGVQAGVRQPVGALDVLAGGRLAFALLMTRDHDAQACPIGMSCPFPPENERVNELRVGAYVGLAVPRTSTLRFRTELSAELATPDELDSNVALTPSWALGALVGMEVAP